MNSMLLDELIEYAGKENVLVSENLKDHTTFKVGGPCAALVQVSSSEIFSKVLKCLEKEKEPYFVIGNGSNLLVSDNGFQGVVLKLTGDFLKVSVEGNRIVAGAGAMVIKVCNDALNNSLSGLEFAYGIPGTVGGAMVMNAGAYDGEMSMVVEKVQLMDKEGKSFSLSCEEMEFGYRDSILKRKDYFVLETTFLLKAGNKEDIKARMDDFLERRRSKQPLEHPSAGSTFKRPEGYFAGKLIMDAGLSGKRIGGVCVSPKHCGFIVNDCGGTAKDISDLIKLVKKEVQDKYGVSLEPEVISIGSFD